MQRFHSLNQLWQRLLYGNKLARVPAAFGSLSLIHLLDVHEIICKTKQETQSYHSTLDVVLGFVIIYTLRFARPR